ncbi:alpha-ketoacid dehydrogenase subunit beta [Sporichthya sp.]|uniref:alpha-ketoacid dehydrogenase subunit beta n=1 Tax=Sporichthya sp. TaxID=65475 RepID=UPI00181720B4|nr:alpha-ketoacid dehydrogenase subunit beta [Sporichthya sp.]
MTFVQASAAALEEALAIDPTVVMFGEDMADDTGGGVFGVSAGLSTKYGDRVRSTPISEQAIMGAAVGAAVAGLRPVVEIMLMNFMGIAMDQFVNHASKLRFMSGGQTPVPLTVRTATGAGFQQAAQHSDMLEAWFGHVAGCKVVTASNPADAKGLLLSCIFDDDPCIFIENTLLYFGPGAVPGEAPPPGHRVPLGKANVVREGSDVTVVSYGRQVIDAITVVDRLAEEGLSVELIDLRTIMPFDERTVLESVAKTKRAVVVHEAVKRCGVGAEVSSRIHEELFGELAKPVLRVGARTSPVPYSAVLEQAYLPQAPQIEAAIRAVTA